MKSCSANRLKSIKIVLLTAALFGFAFQAYQVSDQFFKYASTSQISLRYAYDDNAIDMAFLCFRISDILDITRLERETGIQVQRITQRQSLLGRQLLLTVKQYFDFTPDPEKEPLIDSCMFRPDEWMTIEAKDDVCNQIFNISRYVVGESMCYRFQEKMDRVLQQSSVYDSPLFPNLMFKIYLNNLFKDAKNMAVVVYDKQLPYRSRDFSSILPSRLPRISDDVDCEPEYDFIYMTAVYTYEYRLPPPYDTRCQDRDADDYFTCRKSCLLKKFEAFDRIPASQIWEEKFDKKVFFPENETDEKNAMASTFKKQCHIACSFPPCEIRFSKTTAIPSKERRTQSIGFAITTQTDPDFTATSKPAMTFIDYFSFIAGCFGTWFGLSFLSLNPKSLLQCKPRVEDRPAGRTRKLFEPSPNGMGIHVYVRK